MTGTEIVHDDQKLRGLTDGLYKDHPQSGFSRAEVSRVMPAGRLNRRSLMRDADAGQKLKTEFSDKDGLVKKANYDTLNKLKSNLNCSSTQNIHEIPNLSAQPTLVNPVSLMPPPQSLAALILQSAIAPISVTGSQAKIALQTQPSLSLHAISSSQQTSVQPVPSDSDSPQAAGIIHILMIILIFVMVMMGLRVWIVTNHYLSSPPVAGVRLTKATHTTLQTANG
uniref:Uncharacterized protein n=1 Tax=Romanomermis culicivorax TaxID=13658 RepID=A0A915JJI6_ROMCU